MEPTRVPRVKICCIRTPAEARLAVRHGAAALGLVSAMPSGPGVIHERVIARVAAGVPPPVASVLLTSLQDPAAIAAQHRRVRTTAIQLVDRLGPADHAHLRAALPGIALIQVIHVTGRHSLDEALAAADGVDAVLLDSGDPALPVKQLGGTGRRHDWSVSRRIRRALRTPVFLAGGLHAGNAAAAVAAVGAFGLDVCTGVRTRGALDARKLAAFMRAVGVGATG